MPVPEGAASLKEKQKKKIVWSKFLTKIRKWRAKDSVKLHEASPIIIATTIRNNFYGQVKGFYGEIIIHLLRSW